MDQQVMDDMEIARVARNIIRYSNFKVDFDKEEEGEGRLVVNTGAYIFNGSNGHGIRMSHGKDITHLPLEQQPDNIQKMFKRLMPYIQKDVLERKLSPYGKYRDFQSGYSVWGNYGKVLPGEDWLHGIIDWNIVPIRDVTNSKKKKAGPNTIINSKGLNGDRRRGSSRNTNWKHCLNDSKGWRAKKQDERTNYNV